MSKNIINKLYADMIKRLKKNKDIVISIEGIGTEGMSSLAMNLQEQTKDA